jgi:hypothetical protein
MSNSVPNIEGIWKMTLSGDGYTKSAICTLFQEDTVLVGNFRGSMGNLQVTGAVTNDGEIIFSAKFVMGNLRFSGSLDGETMEGIVDFPMGKSQRKWTAIKLFAQQNT